MIKDKNVKIEILIALGVIVAIILGIVLFGLNIKSSAKKIVSAREEIALRTISLQSLAVLRADYANKVKSYFNVLYNIIPQKDELIDLSKDFQAVASADNLDYGFTFVNENPATADGLGSVRFSLKLAGSLNSLLTFLKDLQNFRYLVNIESVSIRREESTTKMDLAGSVYFRQ